MCFSQNSFNFCLFFHSFFRRNFHLIFGEIFQEIFLSQITNRTFKAMTFGCDVVAWWSSPSCLTPVIRVRVLLNPHIYVCFSSLIPCLNSFSPYPLSFPMSNLSVYLTLLYKIVS